MVIMVRNLYLTNGNRQTPKKKTKRHDGIGVLHAKKLLL
jgi:hypothetical protein